MLTFASAYLRTVTEEYDQSFRWIPQNQQASLTDDCADSCALRSGRVKGRVISRKHIAQRAPLSWIVIVARESDQWPRRPGCRMHAPMLRDFSQSFKIAQQQAYLLKACRALMLYRALSGPWISKPKKASASPAILSMFSDDPPRAYHHKQRSRAPIQKYRSRLRPHGLWIHIHPFPRFRHWHRDY